MSKLTRLAAAAAIAAPLFACAQAQMDIQQVKMLADQLHETEISTCAGALEPLLGPRPAGAGVLYALMVKYEARKLFQPGGPCEGITAEIAVQAVNHFIPGG